MGWLKDFWNVGEPFRGGLVVSLRGEEKYVKEGYLSARENNHENPYSGKEADWWQRGQDNFHNSSFT